MLTGVLVWLALLGAAWWWATRPAAKTSQDRRDLRNIRRGGPPRCLP